METIVSRDSITANTIGLLSSSIITIIADITASITVPEQRR